MKVVQLNPKERFQRLNQGQVVEAKEIGAFLKCYHLTQSQLATLLNVSDKTLSAQRRKGSLERGLSDRFLMLQSVFHQGEEALMSSEVFSRWLRIPNPHFNDLTPLDLLSTINGAEAVRDELIRTQYGVLS